MSSIAPFPQSSSSSHTPLLQIGVWEPAASDQPLGRTLASCKSLSSPSVSSFKTRAGTEPKTTPQSVLASSPSSPQAIRQFGSMEWAVDGSPTWLRQDIGVFGPGMEGKEWSRRFVLYHFLCTAYPDLSIPSPREHLPASQDSAPSLVQH